MHSPYPQSWPEPLETLLRDEQAQVKAVKVTEGPVQGPAVARRRQPPTATAAAGGGVSVAVARQMWAAV
jgi:hypothetical protein